MKQQRINRKDPNKKPTIIDERKPNIPNINIDPTVANLPLRAVFYVEVGDMEPMRVQYLVAEASKMYNALRGGIHYVIPMRHGKIGSDIVFEQEFLNVVHQVCEIKDGAIGLKDGAKECVIVRQQI